MPVNENYKIIQASTPERLSEIINEAMKHNEWQPLGGVSAVGEQVTVGEVTVKGEATMFFQAVTRLNKIGGRS